MFECWARLQEGFRSSGFGPERRKDGKVESCECVRRSCESVLAGNGVQAH